MAAKKKTQGGTHTKGTPLSRTTARWDKQMRGSLESNRTKRLTHRSAVVANRAAGQGASVGRVTRTERKAINLAVKSALSNTTRGEAQGVKRILRRKAKKS